ncbi:hypothetical protein [Microcoleus sp. FACHB-831]|uniref:hypothetical protein n=1 Tax=Microcoleus sp. FACHB-831 TaxID=2692827 RepID=UPI0016827592|nr:hypothetical protein [Microcoleus sp. FACHB-831]
MSINPTAIAMSAYWYVLSSCGSQLMALRHCNSSSGQPSFIKTLNYFAKVMMRTPYKHL